MESVKDSFLDLERHRKLLEENIEKLRKSLQHWQTWEAEYEGLKEEILAIGPSPTHDQLQAIGRNYEGDLVTQKEIKDILGVQTPRSSSQVTNLLDRRIEYVQQNVSTVQKQLDTAENKLAAATVVSDPNVMNEEGLPIMEILEELDDDGNVISGKVTTPGTARPQLLEVLQKAGVEIPAAKPGNEGSPEPTKAPSGSSKILPSVISSKSDTLPALNDKSTTSASPVSAKKVVAFTDDTKDESSTPDSKSYGAKRLEAIIAKAQADAEPSSEPPVIPENESAEDAALRRQMIAYGASEIGAVVAELDLEEAGESDWTEGEEDWDDDSDDEDQYGRSTGKLVDDELREKMLELEKKLGFRAMQNVGKNPNPEDIDVVEEGIGRIKIKKEEDIPKSTLKGEDTTQKASVKSGKKSVQFAPELDIAPSQSAKSAPIFNADSENATRKIAPVTDIVERAPASTSATPTSQPPRKQSRFKSSLNNTSAKPTATSFTPSGNASTIVGGPLADPSSGLTLKPTRPSQPKPFTQPIPVNFLSSATDNPRTVPTGPENAVLASTIVERETPSHLDVAEPDEFDPQLLNQEVAVEYHKMRNKFIGRAGGFMKEEEGEFVPLAEEEGGKKKVSRFKAARLGL